LPGSHFSAALAMAKRPYCTRSSNGIPRCGRHFFTSILTIGVYLSMSRFTASRSPARARAQSSASVGSGAGTGQTGKGTGARNCSSRTDTRESDSGLSYVARQFSLAGRPKAPLLEELFQGGSDALRLVRRRLRGVPVRLQSRDQLGRG